MKVEEEVSSTSKVYDLKQVLEQAEPEKKPVVAPVGPS